MINYNDVYNNKEYEKVSYKAISKYIGYIPKDELEQCRCIGIWNACKDYDSSKSKLTTRIYNHIVWECSKTLRRQIRVLPVKYTEHPIYVETKLFDNLKLLLDDTDFRLISGRFIESKSYKTLAQENSCSVKELRRRLSGLLRRIKEILT